MKRLERRPGPVGPLKGTERSGASRGHGRSGRFLPADGPGHGRLGWGRGGPAVRLGSAPLPVTCSSLHRTRHVHLGRTPAAAPPPPLGLLPPSFLLTFLSSLLPPPPPLARTRPRLGGCLGYHDDGSGEGGHALTVLL